MLLDTTYFKNGLITVASLDSSNSGNTVAEELTILIARYEPEFLRKIFGIELYLKYRAEADPIVSGSRWDKLINGCDYVDAYGRDNIWDGLLRPDTFSSPIANYVFRKHLEGKISQSTTNGEKFNEMENSSPAQLENKIVPIWNEMVDWNREMDLFMKSYKVAGETMFPEYRGFTGIMFNDIDYNITPEFTMGTMQKREDLEFVRLFQHINKLGF